MEDFTPVTNGVILPVGYVYMEDFTPVTNAGRNFFQSVVFI